MRIVSVAGDFRRTRDKKIYPFVIDNIHSDKLCDFQFFSQLDILKAQYFFLSIFLSKMTTPEQRK